MEDLLKVRDAWWELWNIKEEIAFGDTSFDLEGYKELVKDTYYLIQEMHKHIGSGEYSSITPETMRAYMDLVSVISMYSTSVTVDESDNHDFTASRLLAFDLADHACNYSYYREDADYEGSDGVMASIEGFSYGMDRVLLYDVNKGDLTDYYEYAELLLG